MEKTSKIKVLFVIPSLKAGGAERVMSFVAQHLDRDKFESHLVVIGSAEEAAFNIDSIDVHFLNKKRVSKSWFSIVQLIKKHKPHIVVGAIGHVNILISFISILFPKTLFVGRETNVKSIRKTIGTKKSLRSRLKLHKWSLKLLDAIICQSQDMLDDLKANERFNTSKCVVINNPITSDFYYREHTINANQRSYITVGSIHPRKGYPRLFKVLANLDHDFTYTMVGQGDFSEFETLLKKLNLLDKVKHIAFTKEVAELLAKHDVFLNGSYVEGFPNAMVESCAVGTPVVTFDAPGGINEIIEHAKNGFIVNSENEFIATLNQINSHYPFDRKEVSETVMSRYHHTIIISEYEQFFSDLIKGKIE